MIKRYLIVKLLAVNLAVIAFVMAVVWIAIDTLSAGYFVTLMEKYNVSPEPAHAMFVESVHRYLVWACLGGAILSIALSYLLMRRVLTPLIRMTRITGEIAAGNFTARVPEDSDDEVGQLARAFNRMAKSLQEIEMLRRTLMIDVAHELRTPLTNVRGYLEALTDNVLPPSTATFRLLQDETLRLVQLVEDVLQLARADSARGNLKLSPTDLGELTRDALSAVSPLLAEKSIDLDLIVPDTLPIVLADRERIGRVLRNLADNSARYTPTGGDLTVRLVPGPGKVAVDFINDGGDVLSEDLPYLFERFYRGEKSRSREHGGAGIGLSIVKELIEAHDGTVSAHLLSGKLRIRFILPVSHS